MQGQVFGQVFEQVFENARLFMDQGTDGMGAAVLVLGAILAPGWSEAASLPCRGTCDEPGAHQAPKDQVPSAS